MMRRTRSIVLAALVVWTVGVTLTAQAPAPAGARQPATPTFRTGTKLIDLDVYVTDKDGHFVKDLTRDDGHSFSVPTAMPWERQPETTWRCMRSTRRDYNSPWAGGR